MSLAFYMMLSHKLTSNILVFQKRFNQDIINIHKIIYNFKRHEDQIWHFITLSNNFYEFQFLVGLLTPVWHVPLAQVLSYPQLIFPCKTWFFGNLFEFSMVKIT
jgi:hypothetical protein